MRIGSRLRTLMNRFRSPSESPVSSGSFVAGNLQDKYNTDNFLVRLLMSGFLGSFFRLLENTGSSPAAVAEVGCGEGEILKHLRNRFPAAEISATDLSPAVLAQAAQTNPDAGITFTRQNAEHLDHYRDNQFDLVVCLEVLEHLQHPEKGLQELIRISRRDLLVSVPNEPIWRVLNMLRGKYWKHLGNTPGHLNHWSRASFRKFLQSQPGAKIVQKTYPFPWQMIWLQVEAEK